LKIGRLGPRIEIAAIKDEVRRRGLRDRACPRLSIGMQPLRLGSVVSLMAYDSTSTTWECPRCRQINDSRDANCPACGFINPTASFQQIQATQAPYDGSGAQAYPASRWQGDRTSQQAGPGALLVLLIFATVIGVFLYRDTVERAEASQAAVSPYIADCTAAAEAANAGRSDPEGACQYAPGTATLRLRYGHKGRDYYAFDVTAGSGDQTNAIPIYRGGGRVFDQPATALDSPQQATIESWNGSITCVIVGGQRYYTFNAPTEAALYYNRGLPAWKWLLCADLVGFALLGVWIVIRLVQRPVAAL
jgi:hypothetical protein